MKISMWMAYDALSSESCLNNLDDTSKRICLKGVYPYLGPEYLTDNYLYVADATGEKPLVIPATPCYIVFAGENFVLENSSACQYLSVKSADNFNTVLYKVCAAFEKYRQWYDALQSELNGQQNLNSLCALGMTILGNHTLIYDRQYTIIAGDFNRSGENPAFYEEKNGPYYALSTNVIRQLKANYDFQQTFRQSGAAVCKVDFIGHSVLYVNLAQGNVYEGRLCITDFIHPFRNGDYQIAEILTDYIRIAIKRQSMRHNDQSRKFQAFIIKLLDGYIPHIEQSAIYLDLWHWKRFGRYMCISIELSQLDLETSSDVYLCSKLEHALEGSCAVKYNNSIVCIIALTAKETTGEIHEKLDFLKGFVANIGVSVAYADVLETAQYYKQALIAAEMGSLDDRKGWCHFFQDYAMAHYFKHGTSILPAIHFCDEDVKKLLPYEGKRTDYYHTLKVYLENNMNLLETSQALFIHRTTLFNRINKIKELISGNLDSSEDRTRMLLSFKLMELNKTYGRI